VDPNEIEARLRSALERHADVIVAYLFGSTARGRAGPLSDLDVAVLLREGADTEATQLDLIGDLARAAGTDEIDLVVLNDAPNELAFRVIRDGRVLLCRDEAARVHHRVRTILEYLDLEPLRRLVAQGLRHRLTEGTFGRR
jgi:predicted nucleotidyltransferase